MPTLDSMLKHIWIDCATLAIFATKISCLKTSLNFTSQGITQNQINVVQIFSVTKSCYKLTYHQVTDKDWIDKNIYCYNKKITKD